MAKLCRNSLQRKPTGNTCDNYDEYLSDFRQRTSDIGTDYLPTCLPSCHVKLQCQPLSLAHFAKLVFQCGRPVR